MQKLKLSNTDMVAMVDDADYEKCKNYTWIYHQGMVSARIFLSNFILETEQKLDHKNRDPLDNQRRNLRSCNNQQNAQNREKSTKKSMHSKYKGVTRDRQYWVARIKADDRRIHLGAFKSEVEAAKAYDTAATFYFGEFAVLNFSEKDQKGGIN